MPSPKSAISHQRAVTLNDSSIQKGQVYEYINGRDKGHQFRVEEVRTYRARSRCLTGHGSRKRCEIVHLELKTIASQMIRVG